MERKHFPSDQRQTRHLVDGGGSFENRDSEQDEVVMRATVEQESEFSSPGEEGAAINAAGMELQAVLKSREFGHGPTETEISAVEDELSGKLIQRQNEFFDY